MTQIVHWEAVSGPQYQADELAHEEPLEIQVDTRPICVTMRTPGHDEELAAGFLLSEGLIHRREDIAAIEPYWRNQAGNALGVFLSSGVKVDFARLTRHVFASSSCGLCGKASIDAVHQHFPPVRADFSVSAEMLASLPEQLRQAQEVFQRTGGLHAAALFSAAGEIVVVREDVGRHNAVDKVLGHGLLQNLLPFSKHVLMVSGRSSFEIVQKALAAQVPIVAAVSAPSSLAVKFARRSGQTLVGFLRHGRMNVYSRADRICFTPAAAMTFGVAARAVHPER